MTDQVMIIVALTRFHLQRKNSNDIRKSHAEWRFILFIHIFGQDYQRYILATGTFDFWIIFLKLEIYF